MMPESADFPRQNELPHGQTARKNPKPKPRQARRAARMESQRPLSRHRQPGAQARSRAGRRRLRGLRAGLQGQAGGDGRRAGRAAGSPAVKRLRGAGGPARPADLLCRAGLCRQHDRSGPRQVLWRRAGAHHRRLAPSAVLHARAQPHRRRRARSGDARSGARPLPAVDRGRAQGKALSARGPGRAAVPREVGHRLFGLEPAIRRDHRRAALQDRRQGAGDRAGAQSDAGRRRQEAQGGGGSAGARPSRKICARSR